jgi:hypothetical protein
MRSVFKDALLTIICVPVRLIVMAAIISAVGTPSPSRTRNGAHDT